MNRKLKLWELERVSEEEFLLQEKFPIVLILDDIRSLNNIGSFFRTADAFNIEKIILSGITATPPHREIEKTALGATETVLWEHHENIAETVRMLKMEGYLVLSVEQAEETILLHHIHKRSFEKIALIFGNEVDGVNQAAIDNSDGVLEIPQFGTKHSLNVSVCAGVVCWEIAKKFFPS